MNASNGALHDVRVIDLSRVLAGPYCTQILADHGARVLKIEPPQGDETRGWGPPFAADGTASYFLGLNRNKEGRTLDLNQPQARQELLALLADADVLVENFKIGTMERWGLGWDALSLRFPRLIYCRVSGFGADGPLGGLPGYDAAIQALCGIMSVNGEADERGGAPLRVGLPVVDMVTGLNAALGILFFIPYNRPNSFLIPLPVGLTWHDWQVAPFRLANFGSETEAWTKAARSNRMKYVRADRMLWALTLEQYRDAVLQLQE